MAENSKISWTHHTFNPWIGCQRVSAGCVNCYAETLMDKRWNKVTWGPQGERKRTSDAYWRKPHAWNRKAEREGIRYRIFCGSLCDVFEDRHGIDPLSRWRAQLWGLIEATPHLDWLLLTKRPENALGMLPKNWRPLPPNIWLGTSVENQEAADRRIPELLQVPATVRFLSCEPLLGPIDIGQSIPCGYYCDEAVGHVDHAFWAPSISSPIHWVIAGGESGPGCRPMDVAWARDLVRQCEGTYTPVFVKQMGGYPNRREDLSDIPGDLRIRQFPKREDLYERIRQRA